MKNTGSADISGRRFSKMRYPLATVQGGKVRPASRRLSE